MPPTAAPGPELHVVINHAVVNGGAGVPVGMARILGRLVLFVVVLGLMNIAGLLVFCLGGLVTLPVSLLMLASLFDELCGDLDPTKS